MPHLPILRAFALVPREGKPPLLAVHAMRRADESDVVREPAAPPLVVRDARGAWTDDFRALRRAMGMP